MAKKQTKKTSEGIITGSIDESYELNISESQYVHFYARDYGAPRGINMNEEFKVQKRLNKVSPENFVIMFSDNYLANNAMGNINTPGTIVRILRNLTKDRVKEIYEHTILSATRDKTSKEKANFIDHLHKSKCALKMVGSNYIVKPEDILHVPVNHEKFPFDPKQINEFPEECIY